MKYTIGEAGHLLGVKPHVIRYWEEEIPFIAPQKSVSGRREYSEGDLQRLYRLKHLLYDKRYTLEGAQRQIWAETQGLRADTKSKIAAIRSDLIKIWSRIKR